MDDKEKIDLLIDKKIAEAKLELAEKRLNHTITIGGLLVVIAGIVVPIFMVNQSGNRLDSAILQMKDDINRYGTVQASQLAIQKEQIDFRLTNAQNNIDKFIADQKNNSERAMDRINSATKDMKQDFNRLAGEQLRKPILECRYNNKPLEGQTLYFSELQGNFRFQLFNTGDRSATSINIILYLQDSTLNVGAGGMEREISEEPMYQLKYPLNLYRDFKIEAKLSTDVVFDLLNIGSKTYPALIKVFYGEIEPSIVKFTISGVRP